MSTVCKMSALVIIVVIGVIFFCTDGERTIERDTKRLRARERETEK